MKKTMLMMLACCCTLFTALATANAGTLLPTSFDDPLFFDDYDMVVEIGDYKAKPAVLVSFVDPVTVVAPDPALYSSTLGVNGFDHQLYFDDPLFLEGFADPVQLVSFDDPLFMDAFLSMLSETDSYPVYLVVLKVQNLSMVTDTEFFAQTQDTVFLAPQTQAVPEPASMLLIGSGLIGLASLVRRKNN